MIDDEGGWVGVQSFFPAVLLCCLGVGMRYLLFLELFILQTFHYI